MSQINTRGRRKSRASFRQTPICRGCLKLLLSEDVVHAGEEIAEMIFAHFGVLDFIEGGVGEVFIVKLAD